MIYQTDARVFTLATARDLGFPPASQRVHRWSRSEPMQSCKPCHIPASVESQGSLPPRTQTILLGIKFPTVHIPTLLIENCKMTHILY